MAITRRPIVATITTRGGRGGSLSLRTGESVTYPVQLTTSEGVPYSLAGLTSGDLSASIRSAAGVELFAPAVAILSTTGGLITVAITATHTASAQRNLSLTIQVDSGSVRATTTIPFKVLSR